MKRILDIDDNLFVRLFDNGTELSKEDKEKLEISVRNSVPVRPQGEREFIEILAQNVPEDLCTYPEYKGKPYYSIHYKENGEDFAGFGTYNPEVLSRYLRDYFMKGGADNETD